MKITIILPVYWPAIGGCELHTRELIKQLSARHSISVVTLIDNQKDKLSNQFWLACILRAPARNIEYMDGQTKVVRLSLSFLEKCLAFPAARVQSPKLPSIVIKWAMELLSNIYMKKLLKLIKEADCIHAVHGGVSFLGYAALKAARKRAIPFVYTPLLHLNDKEWQIGKRNNRTTETSRPYNPQLNIIPRAWTDPSWYQLCFAADHLITMTEFEKSFFIERGVDPKKITRTGVGPLVAGAISENFREKYTLQTKKIVLFLGRNVEAKGIDELLQAAAMVWKKFPETYFVFAGPVEGNAEKIFQRYQDERIIVLGAVSEELKTAALQACDIFCVPSMEESLGAIFLEAWMFGKPVIGAKIPPLEEISDNGQGGFLVNPVPAELARKIIFLFDNPGRGAEMGRWGRQRVLKSYTWKIVAEKVHDVYLDVLKAAG